MPIQKGDTVSIRMASPFNYPQPAPQAHAARVERTGLIAVDRRTAAIRRIAQFAQVVTAAARRIRRPQAAE